MGFWLLPPPTHTSSPHTCSRLLTLMLSAADKLAHPVCLGLSCLAENSRPSSGCVCLCVRCRECSGGERGEISSLRPSDRRTCWHSRVCNKDFLCDRPVEAGGPWLIPSSCWFLKLRPTLVLQMKKFCHLVVRLEAVSKLALNITAFGMVLTVVLHGCCARGTLFTFLGESHYLRRTSLNQTSCPWGCLTRGHVYHVNSQQNMFCE